jgi:hypothetical protein
MTPHVYMRLRCRRSNVVHQHVDYDLTYDGIEDPKSTIIPICRRDDKSQDGGQLTRFYLYYRDVWVEATMIQDSSELVVFRVPIGAKPVHHELPTP